MKRMLAALLCLFVLVGALSACMSAEEKTPETAAQPSTVSDSPNGLTDFSFALLRETDTEQNTVLSPLSVYYCLTLAVNAADGETKQQLEQALGGSTAFLNTNCQSLQRIYADLGGSTALELANAVFTDNGFPLREDYRERVMQFLDADICNADLSAAEGMQTINDWASEKTHGIIDSLLTEPPKGPAVLLNAIYLHAAWKNPFAAKDTEDGIFTTLSGEEITVDFMHEKSSTQQYLKADGVEGVLLPYDDGKLYFAALLPEDYHSFVAHLDAACWQELLASQESVSMKLALPRFSIEQETELKPLLQALGIRDLFIPDIADLGGMVEEGGNRLYVERVFQKASIEVGEEGTVAAAVTGMMFKTTSLPMDSEMVLSFDRPFVYAVLDGETGVPLFLGTVTAP